MQPMISVYQLKNIPATRYLHDKSFDELEAFGQRIDFDNYEKVGEKPADVPDDVEALKYNKRFEVLEFYYSELDKEQLPEWFNGHPINVGDIISIYFDGEDRAYYVDDRGFKEVPDFFPEGEGFTAMAQNEPPEVNSFDNLPGFEHYPRHAAKEMNYQPQQTEFRDEMHFYTSLYIELGQTVQSKEEAQQRMESYLQEIAENHSEFSYTIHDAEFQSTKY